MKKLLMIVMALAAGMAALTWSLAAGTFKTGVDAKGKDMVAKATCATAVCPDGEPDATGAFEASVFVYFPPKGAFAGYSACIRLRWNGTQFVVP